MLANWMIGFFIVLGLLCASAPSVSALQPSWTWPIGPGILSGVRLRTWIPTAAGRAQCSANSMSVSAAGAGYPDIRAPISLS